MTMTNESYSENLHSVLQKKRSDFSNSKKLNEENFIKLGHHVIRGESMDLAESLAETNHPIDFQNESGMTLLHLACKNAQQDSVRVLLHAGADPNKSDSLGRSPLHWALDVGCHCQYCCNKAFKCLDLLLVYGANPNAADNKNETPLRYAAKSLLSKCALELLDHGAEIVFESNPNCIKHLLKERMPEVLVHVLDRAITFDETDNTRLKLDFGWFYQANCNGVSSKYPTENDSRKVSELTFLVNVAKGPLRSRKLILTHPWIQAFLHLKWMAVRKWFLITRLAYGIFLLLHTFFIFHIYIFKCPYNKFYSKKSPNATDFLGNEIGDDKTCEFTITSCFTGAVLLGGAMLMIMTEFFGFTVDIKSYLTNCLNILWWLLIITLLLTLPPAFGMTPRPWHYPTAAYGLFFTWAMNLSHISHKPAWGEYIEVLGKVLSNFFTFLCTFGSLVVAFTMGMCIMFPENEFFTNIPLGFVKILILMIGEDDYEGLFKSNSRLEELEYSIPAHIMYAGFIAIITIILTNLLLGLSVSDIQELRKQSSLIRTTRKIIQISMLESFINSSSLISLLVRRIFPNSTVESTYGRTVTISPLNPCDNMLPEELKQKFLPYLTSCPCLNKHRRMKMKTILAPIRWKNYAKQISKGTFPNAEPAPDPLKLKKITELEQIRVMLRSLSENVGDLKDQLEKLSLNIDNKL